jgi:S-formylglutathione hydrolase FrmB
MNVRLTRSANYLVFAAMLCWIAPAVAVAQPFHFETGQFFTEALSSNLFGDSSVRPYKVYLPPSYDTTTKRYPVIYVLHGFTQTEESLGAVGATLDSMIRKRTAREMIVVFVNAENRLRGSFYLSSQVIGDYETYIAQDLVNLIDGHYRTLNVRESRGISGFSMGGWGAMHLALKFPAKFSVAVPEAGFYDSTSQWANGAARELVRLGPTNLDQLASIDWPAAGFQALFAGLLPNAERPPLFTDYPYQIVNGEFVPVDSARTRCQNGDVQNGDVGRYLQQSVRLTGIRIVHGAADSLVPVSEARQFTNALAVAGIPFEYVEHANGHEYRREFALPFFSAHLQGAELYVSPPRLSLMTTNNSLQVAFPTQTGVTYWLETSGGDGNSLGMWTEKEVVPGSGQPAMLSYPLPADRQFFRVRAMNTDP